MDDFIELKERAKMLEDVRQKGKKYIRFGILLLLY